MADEILSEIRNKLTAPKIALSSFLRDQRKLR
jgi:hypothetical protein